MRLLLTLLAMLVLGGCGTMADPTTWFGEGAEKIAELKPLENRIEPEIAWRYDTGSGTGGLRLGLVPAVTDERVFVADRSGRVSALDSASGEQIWQVETGLTISGAPGYGEGLVLLGTEEAMVVVLDAATGEERWRNKASSEVLATPVAAEGVVIAHTLDDKLIAYDAGSGNFLWRYDHQMPVLTLRGSGVPATSRSAVLCGLSGGRLVSLDIETGRSLWEAAVVIPSGRSELERVTDIDGEPLIIDGTVYVATYQGVVAALGETTGRTLWSTKLSSYNKVAIDWQRVFVADADGALIALDADTGERQWSYDDLRTRKLSPPAVFGGYLVVGDLEGYVHFFDAESGRPVARIRIGDDPITAPPVVLNGALYVLGDGGELAAIHLPGPKSF